MTCVRRPDAVNDVLAAACNDVVRQLGHVARWASEAAMLGGGRLFNLECAEVGPSGLDRRLRRRHDVAS